MNRLDLRFDEAHHALVIFRQETALGDIGRDSVSRTALGQIRQFAQALLLGEKILRDADHAGLDGAGEHRDDNVGHGADLHEGDIFAGLHTLALDILARDEVECAAESGHAHALAAQLRCFGNRRLDHHRK